MFSKFVGKGNRVLMTANLRSSQLVLRLAQLQKSTGMQVVRMTDWTDLSEVQQAEETLFSEAYDAIEAALRRPARPKLSLRPTSTPWRLWPRHPHQSCQ